jgi:hypothetical protein
MTTRKIDQWHGLRAALWWWDAVRNKCSTCRDSSAYEVAARAREVLAAFDSGTLCTDVDYAPRRKKGKKA